MYVYVYVCVFSETERGRDNDDTTDEIFSTHVSDK